MTPDWVLGYLFLLIKLGVVLIGLLTIAAYLTLAERKLLGRMQVRYGPNRAGKFGLLQPLADVIKMLTKEDTVPQGADRIIFLLAPAVVATTALLIFAVIPFGKGMDLHGPVCSSGDYRSQCGPSFCPGPFFDQRLWGCPGRMGLQFKIQPSGRHPGRGPDDQL